MITKNGGLTGDYKLMAAINSDGNSVCEEKDKFILNPLKQEIKLGLFETVGKQKFVELKYQSGAKKDDYTAYCNDCYKTRMYIFERGEKSKFKTYSFDMNMATSSDEPAARLFGQVIDSYSCPPARNN